MTKTTQSLNLQLANEVRPLILRMGRQLRTRAMRVGSSPMDAQLLSILQAFPGIGVSDLANIEDMSNAAMSAHIRRLLERQLVEKVAQEEGADRRRVSLRITAKAQILLQDVNAERTGWLRERLRGLSIGDLASLHEAAEVLKKLHVPELTQF